MPEQLLYPSLNTILNVDELPQPFDSVLGGVVNKLFYKNHYAEISQLGDSAYHSLILVFNSKIGFSLFGGTQGLELLFNPGNIEGTTELPISFYYNLPILRYTQNGNLSNLHSVRDYVSLILEILSFPEEELLFQVINVFSGNYEDPIASFVNQFNDNPQYSTYPRLILPETDDFYDAVIDIAGQFNANHVDALTYLLENFIGFDNIAQAFGNINLLFQNWFGTFTLESFKGLFIPKFSASLPQLELALAFPRTWLKPVDLNGQVLPGEPKSKLRYDVGGINFSSESGFEFLNANSFSFDRSEIGNTGLILGFTNAKFDFSKTSNIPEADAAGYPIEFVGVYVQQALVEFTKFGKNNSSNVSAAIIADNLFLGTGGVSGQIALESNGALFRDFGNFAVELNRFAIDFRMGSIINCDIAGTLRIGKFEQNGNPLFIDIRAHIFDNGDFKITAQPLNQPIRITWPNVFEIEIHSLSVGKEDRGFYAEVSGVLDFIADIPVLGKVLPTGITVKNLRIWDNGELDFANGGSLKVAKAFSLKIGPVNLSVNNLTIGSYTGVRNDVERRYKFFGFDGVINTGTSSLNAAGNGIKYYYTVDNNDTDKPFHSFLSIDEIKIDLTIPSNGKPDEILFALHGYLSMKNPDPSISGSAAAMEYTGAVFFTMPKLKLAGSAAMRLNPSVPSFLVDIGLEVSTPIPLGATGLGIYGFRGLFGQHYKASKSATTPPLPEDASWWEYYKAKSVRTGREGIEIDKFSSKPGFSLGAGVSIATAFDSGKIFSSKLFLYLGLPDLILIQGQAAILRNRIGLQDDVDPPFSALVIIENNSFRANLGVNYNLPDSGGFKGGIFSLNGTLDMAFFFNNASGWYLNVGKDQPETERVRASILTLFRGYAYLMISSRGFKAGAGARFDVNLNFGIASAGVGAYIDMAGSVSFKPVQIGAFIQLGGYAYLKILWIRFGVSVQVTLAVEAPHPFNISGSLEIGLKLPWPIKRITLRLSLKWNINNNNSPLLEPIAILGLPDKAKGYLPAAAVNMASGETFGLNYVDHEFIGANVAIPPPDAQSWTYDFTDALDMLEITIPLDSFIDIDLLKPVKPLASELAGAGNQLPGGYLELLPPQKGLAKQVSHEFELTGVEIYIWKAEGGIGSWQPYHVYEAVTAIVENNTGVQQVNLASLKAGFWQFNEQGRYNKIRILSQNMFSYRNKSADSMSDLDALNFRRKDLFCFEMIERLHKINWKQEILGTTYPENENIAFQDIYFSLNNVDALVANDDAGSTGQSLKLQSDGGVLSISLEQALNNIKLQFGTIGQDITISFVKTIYRPSRFGSLETLTEIVSAIPVLKGTLNAVVENDNEANTFDKILIHFSSTRALSFQGNLNIGGYFSLPSIYVPAGLPAHFTEIEKSIMNIAFYGRAFSEAQVLDKGAQVDSDAIGSWPSAAAIDTTGGHLALVSGNPDVVSGYYQSSIENWSVLKKAYHFTANADAAIVPFYDEIYVEDGDFSFELTVAFNPFSAGISTLFSKIEIDEVTGAKKGYALHLMQDTPADATISYTNVNLPKFSIRLTFYDGFTHSSIQVQDFYTMDCANGKVSLKQYKPILVSVNRAVNQINVFISQWLLGSFELPAELNVAENIPVFTYLDQISYQSLEEQKRFEDNELSEEKLIDEVQIMNSALNKTIQPLWRPNSIYALKIKTRDVVNGNVSGSSERNQVFGFKTAGPIGHFEEFSSKYQALKAADKVAEFKLGSLKPYIDYERSSPDAMGRFEENKPVYYEDPKVNLVFLKPYMNAMFSNWASYQGTAAVNSDLLLEVISPFGETFSAQLVWEWLPEQEINDSNFNLLPADEQVLYLMNKAAAADNCNVNPIILKKRIKQGRYVLPDLAPGLLYTALFSATYQPAGETLKKKEVHKYNFKTSAFANFQQQASSFIKTGADENPYFYYTIYKDFSAQQIQQELWSLLDDNFENDLPDVQRFSGKYERVVYGGFGLRNLEAQNHSIIEIIVNIDTANENQMQILGLLIRNPEPFNDTKLSAELLSDTIGMELTKTDQSTITAEDFIYLHSRDTASVFITNADMNLPSGAFVLTFKQKIFNGYDYNSLYEQYISPSIPLNIGLD